MAPNRPRTLLALAASAAALATGCSRGSAAAPQAPGGIVEHLDAARFRALAEQKQGLYLDVRTPGEVAGGRIPGASTIDVTDDGASRKLALLPRARPIFVYCASGARSASAARTLGELGFAEVYDLRGGLYSWARSGFPLERGPAAPPRAGAAALTPAALDGLLQGEQRLLVDYQTPWCEPCRRMAPVIDAVTVAWRGRARVLRVDVDQSEALAAREKVEGVPLLVLYVGGRERWRHSGELPREAIEAELSRP